MIRISRSFSISLAVAILCTIPVLAGDRPIIRASKPVVGYYFVRMKARTFTWLETGKQVVAQASGRYLDSFPDIKTLFVQLSEAQAVRINANPFVEAVEEDSELSIVVTNPQTGVDSPPSGSGAATLWGLDRIDQPYIGAPRLDNSYGWCSDGTGVRIYMIDTGVYPGHDEFTGRVDTAPDLQTYLHNFICPTTGTACDLGYQCWDNRGGSTYFTAAASHGTATASVAAGINLGVAKGATLVDARGADCYGRVDTYRVTKIVDWICRLDLNRTPGRMVINMSFSGLYAQGDPNYQALQSEINTAVDTYNIPVVCAAGNDSANEFWYSPGNATRAITVGGLSKVSDTIWSVSSTYGSNYGYTVSFYAPAQYVEGASTFVRQIVGNTLYRSQLSDCASYTDTCTSGTSFAAPHMAGVIARYLQLRPGATRDQIVSDLQNLNGLRSGATVTEPGGRSVPVLVIGWCTQ